MLLAPWLLLASIAIAVFVAAPLTAFFVARGCKALGRRRGLMLELAAWLAGIAILLLTISTSQSWRGFDAMLADAENPEWVGAAAEVLALQTWALATFVFAVLMRFDRQITGSRKIKDR